MFEARIARWSRRLTLKTNARVDLEVRLRTIEGHVRGIRKMVAEEGSCASVLQQVAAVQRALVAVTARLIDDHVDDCLEQMDRERPDRHYERAVRQLEQVYGMGRIGVPTEELRPAMEEPNER